MAPDLPHEALCPRCAGYVSEYWRYCPVCSQPLFASCPKCSNDTAMYWEECLSCGASLDEYKGSEYADDSSFPCPVCGKYVVDKYDVCLHCRVELVWMERIPYKKAEYPSRAEQIPRRISQTSECPFCGDMVRANWNTCPQCGETLHEIA